MSISPFDCKIALRRAIKKIVQIILNISCSIYFLSPSQKIWLWKNPFKCIENMQQNAAVSEVSCFGFSGIFGRNQSPFPCQNVWDKNQN